MGLIIFVCFILPKTFYHFTFILPLHSVITSLLLASTDPHRKARNIPLCAPTGLMVALQPQFDHLTF